MTPTSLYLAIGLIAINALLVFAAIAWMYPSPMYMRFILRDLRCIMNGEGKPKYADAYANDELVRLAMAYATPYGAEEVEAYWPWTQPPSEGEIGEDRYEDIAKAAAFLCAELARLERRHKQIERRKACL